MVEPMPPTPAGGDTPPVPTLPSYLLPPVPAGGARSDAPGGAFSEWTPSPAPPVSVASVPASTVPAHPVYPPHPMFPQRMSAPPVPAASGRSSYDPVPQSVYSIGTAPAAERSWERDPWATPAVGEPEAADVPETRRSFWKVLWPWGARGLLESLEVLLLALVMFAFVRSLGQNFVVDGGSMEPTFHNGEMLIVNKIVYRTFDISWLPWSDENDWRPFGEPKPGDVVVFQFPQNPSRDFIKRVIAVAGQTVEVRGGQLLIDGVVHAEPFLSQPPAYDYGPATVPEGQYFVLGDNRNNSYDSHAWGMLDNAFMIGRAELRYWPPERAGRVGNDDPPTPQAGVSRSQ